MFKNRRLLMLFMGKASQGGSSPSSGSSNSHALHSLGQLLPALFRDGVESWNPTVNKMTGLALTNLKVSLTQSFISLHTHPSVSHSFISLHTHPSVFTLIHQSSHSSIVIHQSSHSSISLHTHPSSSISLHTHPSVFTFIHQSSHSSLTNYIYYRK
jgi:hypothetical protein